MKRIFNLLIVSAVMLAATSCEYFYSLKLENNYGKGIYIWSAETGLKMGNDPTSLDELNDKWYMHYVDAGEMGSFADKIGGKMSAKEFVDDVFYENDVLFVAIFDAETLDNNWGVGKMSDYVIQKYWLRKEDVIEDDGMTYKTISFPPNEGMRNVQMWPMFGTYSY